MEVTHTNTTNKIVLHELNCLSLLPVFTLTYTEWQGQEVLTLNC